MKQSTIIKLFIVSLLIIAGNTAIQAQSAEANQDESKVPVFDLPEILKSNSGEQITTKEQWEKIRRPELMNLFAEQMYGRTPDKKIDATYELLSEDTKAYNGKATRKQVRITFKEGKIQRQMLLLIYLPNQIKGKSPLFFSMNFSGNQTISSDTCILPSPNTTAIKRGSAASNFPVELILSKGYGLATACYTDLFPDQKDKHAASILPMFGYTPEQPLAGDSWQALGVWAWSMSRAMDYFQTDKRIDATKVALMGHSRIGKATIWAGAQDPRFAIIISNNSGCGGAALSKRAQGETVKAITTSFPHWFCPNFAQYSNNESKLTFDQHELIALIAPRPVYVASAEKDDWADQKGEFLSAYYAGVVYKLYGYDGLPSLEMPPLNTPVMNRVGYHIRTGGHDVTEYDWKCYLEFADKHLRK